MKLFQSLKDNKAKPSIKFLIILLIFIIYLVFSYLWSVKSDVYAFDYLPQDTIFYYEWTNEDAFDLEPKQEIPLIDLSVPNKHLAEMKNLIGNKFVDVEEVVWFKTGQDGEDYYLLKFRSISDKFVQNLKESQNLYNARKHGDSVLFVYKENDLVLPELMVSRFSINHIKKGNNMYWKLGKEPNFLSEASNGLKNFLSYEDVYLNIQKNSLNLFQIYNEGKELDDKFSEIFFPRDFDMLLGLRASSTAEITNYVANQVVLANFSNLPYFNLTQDKFNDYFLKDSFLWQKKDNWLLVKQDDWWPLITDLSSSLQLDEKKNILPDGTAYIELVVKEDQNTQHFQYMGYELWQIGGIIGTNINNNYYISNNRQVLESLISEKNNFKSMVQSCAPANSYNVMDILWWDNKKVDNEDLKKYFVMENIPNFKLFTYQNSIIQGINWCF